MYCTRKITRTKFNSHKNITIRSLKNYSQDVYLEELNKINFSDYSKFTDINDAYSDFIGKVSLTIDNIAPMKEIRIKNGSKEWFDEEILEEIEKRDKLLAKFKKSRQPSDSQNYKIARNKVQGMIKKKQKNFIAEKLNQNIGKPKELWKSLKSLGLPSKQQSSSTICLEKDGILSFDHKANAEIFKDFYSNLASDLVKKLPNPPNKIGTGTVREYYKNLNLEEKSFAFEPTTHAVVLKLLEDLNPSILLYVNDMPQAVNSELLLYADDTCLFFMGKDSKIIGDQLIKDFNSLCEWFIDNKLSIHFGEEKTKSILFGTKQLLHKGKSLNIRYGDTEIKQHTKVTYLGCILDNDLSGESMVTKVLSLINGRLKFFKYRKQKFLTFSLRRLLCNALIQPHYDYACSAWYPSLNKDF